MAAVLLFHHALGLTDGVREFADRLRAEGHDVETPDLFEGMVFASLEDGVAHAEDVGFGELADRGVAAAADVGGPFVAAGFSLGALPAQKLAQTRPGVLGAVLYHAAVPIETFGEAWPPGVALQMHFCEDDPWVEEDLEVARGLVDDARGELHLYPGSGHLVADPGSADFDPALAETIVRRTLEFVARCS